MNPRPVDKRLWPQVGLIRSYFPTLNGWFAVGTGTLINSRAVLTAGHVVYDHLRGGKANRFEIVFGGGATTSSLGTNGRVLNEFISSNPNPNDPRSPYDLGVILLSAEDAVNGVTPASVFQTKPANLVGLEINLVGYPVIQTVYDVLYGANSPALNPGQPWNGYLVNYNVNTIEGMSGGPVYPTVTTPTNLGVRAIHTCLYNGMGYALTIYEGLANQIGRWLDEL